MMSISRKLSQISIGMIVVFLQLGGCAQRDNHVDPPAPDGEGLLVNSETGSMDPGISPTDSEVQSYEALLNAQPSANLCMQLGNGKPDEGGEGAAPRAGSMQPADGTAGSGC